MVGLAWLFRTLARAAYLRDAAAASGFFAHGYFTVGLSWLAVALARYGGLPWGVAAVAVALLAAYLALWWAIAGGITHWLWRRLGTVRALVPAALWTLAEWGRGGLLTGFPWLMPGFAAAHDAATRVLVEGLVDLGLLSGEVDTLIAEKRHLRFYPHRTGHWLGLDVHDVGPYQIDGQSITLQPGMVTTIEPGLYIDPAEDIPRDFWGIGIRIEDDALVTETGCTLLTRDVPVAIDEIEALMRGG